VEVKQSFGASVFDELQSDIDAAISLSVLVLGFALAVILAVRYLTARSAAHEA
jgi:ABC-type sulfate transport system permease component